MSPVNTPQHTTTKSKKMNPDNALYRYFQMGQKRLAMIKFHCQALEDLAESAGHIRAAEADAPALLHTGGWALPRSIFATEYEFRAFMAPTEAADRVARAVVERSLWDPAGYQSLPARLQQQVVQRARDLGMYVPADFLQDACTAPGQLPGGDPGCADAAPRRCMANDSARRDHIRQLCLSILDDRRPGSSAYGCLLADLQCHYRNATQHELLRALDYLELKGLLTITRVYGCPDQVRLTCEGIDLVDGQRSLGGL